MWVVLLWVFLWLLIDYFVWVCGFCTGLCGLVDTCGSWLVINSVVQCGS